MTNNSIERVNEDGQCGGYTVYIPEGETSLVLGPDGNPVSYLVKYKVGFDLRKNENEK